MSKRLLKFQILLYIKKGEGEQTNIEISSLTLFFLCSSVSKETSIIIPNNLPVTF